MCNWEEWQRKGEYHKMAMFVAYMTPVFGAVVMVVLIALVSLLRGEP